MKKEKLYKPNNRWKRLFVFTIFIFLSILSVEVFADPLIIDHTAVDKYNIVPQYWIDQVKKMWVTVPGESHSSGYRIGLNLLEAADSRFQVNILASGTPEGQTDQYLRFSCATRGDVTSTNFWRYSYGEEDWYTSQTAIDNTKAGITYCNTTGPVLSAMGFGWCWDMTSPSLAGTEDLVYRTKWAGRSYYWNGTSLVSSGAGAGAWGLDTDDVALTGNIQGISMDTYLNATQQYIDYCTANIYPTKVFFTTGPIDGNSGENAYQRYLKHEHIRNYVKNSSDEILFDYADILSWSNAGVQDTQNWTDYGGTPHTFQYIHSDNMLDLDGTYTEDGDHIGQRGALRLGKAMWCMLAQMAGWDGTTEVEKQREEVPQVFNVLQNYPNPFNPSTKIQFIVPSDGHVRIRVYNCLGQIVATPFESEAKAGQYQAVQINSSSLSSGVYFYSVEHRGQRITKQMVVIK
jgi:hypothetical protein